MKKIIIICVFFSFCGISGYARQHEFSVHGAGGSGGLNYDLSEISLVGSQRGGFGSNFGASYRYFFHPKLGFVTGMELALYRAKSEMNETFSHSYVAFDGDSDFDFHTSLSDYEERQRVTMLQIPLMLQFQTGIDADARRFYAAAGTKIGIPLKARYDNKATLVNACYYAYEDYWYRTDRFRGFGTFADEKDEGDLDFKTAVFASVELGVKWKLNGCMSLYTGAYLDYGLNNIIKSGNNAARRHIVEYNAADPTNFTINSIVNSKYSLPAAGNERYDIHQPFTDRMVPTTVGVMVRLAFGKR